MTRTSHDNGDDRTTIRDNAAYDKIDFLEYWRILVERRNVIFTCLTIIVAATALFTFVATPEYKATTILQIERQGPDILTFRDISPIDYSWAAYSDFYQTQYRLLQSRTVLRLAAERLDLIHNPAYMSRRETPLGRLMNRLSNKIEEPPEEKDLLDAAAAFIHGGLSIKPVVDSHLVSISFLDRDAALAADVANAVADAYQYFSREARFTTTEVASDFLTKQVARLQGEITELERQLQEYGSEKEILALSDGTQDISEQALADINARLSQARARYATTRARLESLQETSPDSLPELLNSQLINNLKQDYAELERKHTQMSERFKPGWPELMQVKEELEQAASRLEAETAAIVRKVTEGARSDYLQARAEVAHLEEQVGIQKQVVKQVNRDAIVFTGLRAEIETRRNVLNDLVARQSQTKASEQLHDTSASNIWVVDKAAVPGSPTTPRKALNITFGTFVGLLVGIGMALLLHYLDNTIKMEQDIERYYPGLPVLGHIPLLEPLQITHGRKEIEREERGAAGFSMLDPDLNSHTDSRSTFAEAFKNLRTSLLLASSEHPPRWISVTSCEPNDGKSTIAVNLAIVLTQMGKKVLLVDADLRRPRLNKIFGLTKDVGLSSVLSGNSSVEEAIHETHVPNLHLVTSGPIPPNPSELLDSAALSSFMSALEQYGYEQIIFDGAPVIQVADSLILSAKVDATILVVRSGSTARDSLKLGAARLSQTRAHVAGAVLNAIPERGRYYHYKRYRYSRPHDEDDTQSGNEPGRETAPGKKKRRIRANQG